jgi:hypothetical protein
MKASHPAQHPLFRHYPLRGEQNTSAGSLPTPYHVYDGCAMLITGTADLAEIRRLLAGEQVAPVQTSFGRALMAVWVCEFTRASLGPHQELQISIVVSRQPLAPVAPHPLIVLKLLALEPQVGMLCHGLWNDSPQVVAYNRELLGLDARLAQGTIQGRTQAGPCRFEFRDPARQALILQGQAAQAEASPLAVTFGMVGLFGLGGMLRLARLPWIAAAVVNPVSPRLPRNAWAQTFALSANPVVRFFDPQTDRLEFGLAPYQELDFQPQMVEHLPGYQMVYLQPEER